MTKKKNTFLVLLAVPLLLVGCSSNKNSSSQETKQSNTSSTSIVESPLIEGEGTKESPYLIANKAQLKNISSKIINGGNASYYKLTADINYDDEWSSIGNTILPFSGVFDGDGYTISGIKFTTFDKSNMFYGFFGYSSNAVIKNLNLTNVEINLDVQGAGSSFYLGGVVGYGVNVNISNVHVSYADFTVVSLQNSSSQIIAGGIIGFESIEEDQDNTMYYVAVENSSVDGNITLNMTDAADTISAAAGIVGYSSTGAAKGLFNINNSCYNGSIVSGTYAAGIVTRISYYSSIVDSYAHGSSITATDTDGSYAAGIVAVPYYETALIGVVSDYSSISAAESSSTLKSYAGAISAFTYENDFANNGTGLLGSAIYNCFTNDVNLSADVTLEGKKATIDASLFKDTLQYAPTVWDLSTSLPIHQSNPTLDKVTITLDDNYTAEKSAIEAEAGTWDASLATTLVNASLERDNYSFNGYYYDQENTVEYRFYAPINHDCTFYAGWTDISSVLGSYTYECEYYGNIVGTGQLKITNEYIYWISSDNTTMSYEYEVNGNYLIFGASTSVPEGAYTDCIFEINADGTLTGYDINDESAVYTFTKTNSEIIIPDYTTSSFLGTWYNDSITLTLFASGNAKASSKTSNYDIYGGFRFENNLLNVSVLGRINGSYTYDEINDIFISDTDILTRSASTIYETENHSVMIAVTENKTYLVINGSLSNETISGTIADGEEIIIAETKYTISGTTLSTEEEVEPTPTPDPVEDDIPAYCGTWTGKVGLNDYTVVINSDLTMTINGTSFTYTYDSGTFNIDSGIFTVTYDETNKTLTVIYDDGEYTFEGTLSTFLKEETISKNEETITLESLVGTYEGTWGATYGTTACTLTLETDGTGSLANSDGVVFTFSFSVDENGTITTTNVNSSSLCLEDLTLSYDSESGILSGTIYESDQMLDYTISVTKKA